MRVPRPWALITDPTLSHDINDPTDADDAMQNADPAEFTEPMLSADPTDPILSTEPWEAMLSIDPSDHRDHLDAPTTPWWRTPASPSTLWAGFSSTRRPTAAWSADHVAGSRVAGRALRTGDV
jgi:hypothetical protein